MKVTHILAAVTLSGLSAMSHADCVNSIDEQYLARKMSFGSEAQGAETVLNCKKPINAYDKVVCSNPKLKRLDAVSVQSVVADVANQQKWDIDEDQTKSLAKKEYQFRYKKAGKTPESICKFLLKELKETRGGQIINFNKCEVFPESA